MAARSVEAAIIMPHPPLIVPGVGRGREKEIQNTAEACLKAAGEIASLEPETVVLISPHATLYSDYIHISPGKAASGSLKQFGEPREYRMTYDSELIGEISRLCGEENFPAGTLGERDRALDHGALVPLHFIEQKYSGCRFVRVSISGLSRMEHYRFGMLLDRAAASLGRKTVIVASGDLSHKLTADGPYGFDPAGPRLDAELVKIMRSGDFGAFFELDADLCSAAAECGLSGFIIMAGALNGRAVAADFLSYEGPFGVGYAVSVFKALGDDPGRDFMKLETEKEQRRISRVREGEDVYVRLARMSLEHYVKTGEVLPVPDGLPTELQDARAGVFVSLKKRGELRGCIGTTMPIRPSVALEIIHNAVASGTEDSRFSPVRPDELGSLIYSVDVLSPAEPVSGPDGLDPRRYGVIVSNGRKHGLLLPNLEGVDTVGEQLDIACRKAGIDPQEEYSIERFEVTRHK